MDRNPARRFVLAIILIASFGAKPVFACVTDADCDDGNDCTQDLCSAGTCSNPDEPGGTPCGDPSASACDNPDACDGLGACNPNQELNGSPCDDGDVCTEDDACSGGVCFSGAPLNCDDGNACTNDLCDLVLGCIHIPEYDDLWCCSPATGVPTLINDGNDCTDDSCDAGTGDVSHVPTATGTPCDDSDACTVGDECDGAGACVGSDVGGVPCTEDADCPVGVCYAVLGLCLCDSAPVGVCCDLGPICEPPIPAPFCIAQGGTYLGDGIECGECCDCDDGNACTTDSCTPEGLCSHIPEYDDILDCCSPSTGGLTPVDDGNACTDDSCDANTGDVSHVSSPTGTPCDDANLCTADDACDAGYCVGTRSTGCCNTDADCNDYNACTFDTCEVNVCVRTSEPLGTACGSDADTNCTDPDTCDGAGVCLPNAAADGTTCPGAEPCTSGLCSPVKYTATVLEEGDNDMGVPLGGTEWGTYVYVVGRVSSQGVDQAAMWTCDAELNCTLTELPTGGATPSVANAVACDGLGTCLIVGAKDDPSQPAAWSFTGGSGGIPVEESVPLPLSSTGGGIKSIDGPIGAVILLSAVGSAEGDGGSSQATLWERDAAGAWTLFPAESYFDVYYRSSVADDIEICPAGADSLCTPGARTIAGRAEDGLGVLRPVVWTETAEGSGTFDSSVLPLPPGVVGVAEDNKPVIETPVVMWFSVAPPASVGVSGTVVLTDGSMRGVVWTTTDMANWSTAVLPPLPGFGSSTGILAQATVSGGTPPYTVSFSVAGSSFPTGENPRTSGIATLWSACSDGICDCVLAPYYSVPCSTLDANDLVDGLPDGAVLSTANPFVGPVGSPTLGAIQVSIGPAKSPPFETFTLPGGDSSGPIPPPLPHAVLLTPVPQADIPAVSAWGLAVMALLVLTAGTVLQVRRAGRASELGSRHA